jgi:hypothetical protein
MLCFLKPSQPEQSSQPEYSSQPDLPEAAPASDAAPQYKMSRSLVTVADAFTEYAYGMFPSPAIKELESRYNTLWRVSAINLFVSGDYLLCV